MTVISDSSPLIYLAWIGRLDLLKSLFVEIIIPPTVYQEIVFDGTNQPGSKEVANANWIKIQSPKSMRIPPNLQKDLDQGEKEAISLSLELNPKYLVIDEYRGREIAQLLDIPIIGIIGILLIAKQEGLIDMVKDELDELMNKTTFRLSLKLYQKALELANEK